MSGSPPPIDGVAEVAVTRVLEDGTVELGGTALLFVLDGEWGLSDFRDPDGQPWDLPERAYFDVEFSLPFLLPGVPLELTRWERFVGWVRSWLRR